MITPIKLLNWLDTRKTLEDLRTEITAELVAMYNEEREREDFLKLVHVWAEEREAHHDQD